MATERLQKVLAAMGVASRREAERLIAAGHVKVNGQLITQMGAQADPERDQIEVHGQRLGARPALAYVMLNKPIDYLVSRSDPYAKQTIYDLLPTEFHHLHPVGRLDQNSCGLLLLTNDGELTQRLLHPRHKALKRYKVTVKGHVSSAQIKQLSRGIVLEDGPTQATEIHLKQSFADGAELEFNLREGRKRQIRRMCKAMGWSVTHLERFEMGNLKLKNLPSGQYRILSPQEVKRLRQDAGLNESHY